MLMGQNEWGELVHLCTPQYVHRKTLETQNENMIFSVNVDCRLVSKKDRPKERREKCSSRPSVEEVLLARYPALTSGCVKMNRIILQVLRKVCDCTTYSPINSLLKNEWETCKFLVWQIEMKQAHARSVLMALNPQAFDWPAGIMYNLFSAEPCVLFITPGNCFHFCWSHCFLRHEQTDWTESKQNYFLSLKIGNVWIAFPVFLPFLLSTPPCSCDHPIHAVWVFL